MAIYPQKKTTKKNDGYIDKFRRTSIIGEKSSNFHKKNMSGFR